MKNLQMNHVVLMNNYLLFCTFFHTVYLHQPLALRHSPCFGDVTLFGNTFFQRTCFCSYFAADILSSMRQMTEMEWNWRPRTSQQFEETWLESSKPQIFRTFQCSAICCPSCAIYVFPCLELELLLLDDPHKATLGSSF